MAMESPNPLSEPCSGTPCCPRGEVEEAGGEGREVTMFWGRRQIMWVFGSHPKYFIFPSGRKADPLMEEGRDVLGEYIPVLALPGTSYDTLGNSVHLLELTLLQGPDTMAGSVTSRPCAGRWITLSAIRSTTFSGDHFISSSALS